MTTGDPTLVESFRDAIAQAIGLHLDYDKTTLLEELLDRRAAAHGFRDPAMYIALVADAVRGAAEVAVLALELCVGETYFLRDRNQFHALAAFLRAWPLARAPVILSAGCSTGEEPYSIAMTAWENLPPDLARATRILGVDLRPRAIEHAVEGRYTQWSLRETPEATARTWLRKEEGRFVVDDRLRAAVTFQRLNLVDRGADFFRPSRFDLVFCRNILMYLTPESGRRLVGGIGTALAPGGLLFLGHAENLRGLTEDFHLAHTHGTFYYEKRGRRSTMPEAQLADATAPPPPRIEVSLATPSWFERIGASTERIAAMDRRLDAARRVPRAEVGPTARASDDEDDADRDALLVKAVALASAGDATAAEDLCSALLAVDELSAGAHYVTALCREHRGDTVGAAEHDQIAAYLDPTFAMPRLHLGLLRRRQRDVAGARRELELAASLLAREDAARIVLFGGGFTRQALVQLCRAELRASGARG